MHFDYETMRSFYSRHAFLEVNVEVLTGNASSNTAKSPVPSDPEGLPFADT